MAGHTLTADQADYLETLAELAAAYESANYESPPALPPHEFLASHLGNIGMTATEWGKLIGIDRSNASRRLRGERKFNTAHVRKTADALGIEPSHLNEILAGGNLRSSHLVKLPPHAMTLAEFTAIVQATPEAVVLLEGRRSIPDQDAALATHTASMLVKHYPGLRFLRSGNAEGADQAFSAGIDQVAPWRLQVVAPYAAHRKSACYADATNDSPEALSSVQENEVAYKTATASPQNKGLIGKRDKKGALTAKGKVDPGRAKRSHGPSLSQCSVRRIAKRPVSTESTAR